jgi:hypothetical protein
MHVVRLLSPKLENETHTKDIDFSPAGINNRMSLGQEPSPPPRWSPASLRDFRPVPTSLAAE